MNKKYEEVLGSVKKGKLKRLMVAKELNIEKIF